MKPETWGLFPWFPESSEGLVHAEDIVTVKRLMPYGKVFQRTETSGVFDIFTYGDVTFRGKREFFKTVRPPNKQIGDRVFISSNGERVQGVIIEIMWHFEKNSPFYILAIEGKRKSKRYWESDFLNVD
ncbi:MAG: hypothetical protein JNL67_21830 [Planctomycetaceae bacterium]|nr:hypothetical protein [Planctomycetaceae bacterium]